MDAERSNGDHFHHWYPVPDLPVELWWGVEEELVDWRTVKPTQFPMATVEGRMKKLFGEPIRGGLCPLLLQHNGIVYLYDGHHRVANALAQRRWYGRGRVVR